MTEEKNICAECNMQNDSSRYFCNKCGSFLKAKDFSDKKIYETAEFKIKRIVENLEQVPHYPVIWNDTVDLYVRKIEKCKSLMKVSGISSKSNQSLLKKMDEFLEMCHKSEFQIAFVGTIKTGKSTLINGLLGHNYASMAVTPETAALTKFRSSVKDYVKVIFYTKREWEKLWRSRTSSADKFVREYKELEADKHKDKWIGHAPIHKELANCEIENELSIWSSSKRPEHYFVKEIEVGISTLPKELPKQVVFVDTPGLSDPMAYRSEITQQYIRNANAVFVCVEAQKIHSDEIDTISSVFSFSSHNKDKVYIIATHWDKLNDPIEDWKVEKEYMEKTLVAPAFFDTEEKAQSNIMHSAAYVYNLIREYETLDKKQKLPIKQFAEILGMEDFDDVEEVLQEVSDATNIDNIRDTISEKIAGKYQQLLAEDIKKKYLEIVFELRRRFTENKTETQKIIEAIDKDIDEIDSLIERQKESYREINNSKEQLSTLLKLVERKNDEGIKKISEMFQKMVKNA